ncbi:cytochrome P450 [Thozetella sp. PMI_491]|nr:cytochrome P450 [Thozetella sp. PMI_491]
MGTVEKTALYGAGIALILILWRIFGAEKTLRRDGKPLRQPPNTWPLVGNGIHFLQSRQKLFSWFVKCERRYGYESLALTVPSLPPGVLINDPRNIDYVFKNEGVFSKGDFVKQRAWDLFGNGIINADGDYWKIQRKAGLHFLSTANMRVLTDVVLPKYLAESIGYLQQRAGGTVVDLQHVFHEITSQLMGKMAYNMEMHADDDFTVAFEYASGATAERFQNPLFFLTEIFLGAKFRASLGVVKSFGKRIVESATKDRQKGHDVAGEDEVDQISGSLVQSLMDVIADEDNIADAALNYLSAGRDTVAQALTWTFYLLMRHRFVAARIRKEVEQLLRASGVVSAGDMDYTLFTPSAMPYTMAVFYEALRIYPPIPFEFRQTLKSATLPDGTYLPKDSVIVWCTWAMNRSKITWGEDADDFRPERWLSDGKLLSKSPSEFPVFNGGPRTCLGKKMAEVIAVQVTAAMAWQFEFIPVDEKERTSKSSLTLPMEAGLPVIVKARTRELS